MREFRSNRAVYRFSLMLFGAFLAMSLAGIIGLYTGQSVVIRGRAASASNPGDLRFMLTMAGIALALVLVTWMRGNVRRWVVTGHGVRLYNMFGMKAFGCDWQFIESYRADPGSRPNYWLLKTERRSIKVPTSLENWPDLHDELVKKTPYGAGLWASGNAKPCRGEPKPDSLNRRLPYGTVEAMLAVLGPGFICALLVFSLVGMPVGFGARWMSNLPIMAWLVWCLVIVGGVWRDNLRQRKYSYVLVTPEKIEEGDYIAGRSTAWGDVGALVCYGAGRDKYAIFSRTGPPLTYNDRLSGYVWLRKAIEAHAHESASVDV